MIITTLVLGFLFGAVLQIAKLNKYNTISGMATLEDLTVAKAMALAIGVGAILLNAEIGLGLASYHVKPFLLVGMVVGGLLFGAGMAILGYCPGTMVISLGEGSVDALVGVLGGLLGSLAYSLWWPSLHGALGPDLGALSLHSLTGGRGVLFQGLVLVLGGAFIGISFWLNRLDGGRDRKWLYSGLGLALLEVVVFATSVSNRPIGASTAFAYVGDLLVGATGGGYFETVKGPGHWELIFLAGAFLSGLVLSLLRKDFKLELLHERWRKYKGAKASRRVAWALVGAFLLLFGARMAGGCTSGHILSGGMQLAVSSLVFAVFVFAGLLATGRVFYRPAK